MSMIISFFSSILTFVIGNLGMMVFFSLLAFFTIIFVKYLASKLNIKTETKNEEEKKETKPRRFWKIIGIILLFTAVGGAYVWGVFYIIKHSAQHKQQHGTLFWIKPEGVIGKNYKKRNDVLNVVIDRNDAEVMEFTANYVDNNGKSQKAFFTWKKSDGNGMWYQNNPKGSGLLRKMKQDDGEKSFVGEISNDRGEYADINLKLD